MIGLFSTKQKNLPKLCRKIFRTLYCTICHNIKIRYGKIFTLFICNEFILLYFAFIRYLDLADEKKICCAIPLNKKKVVTISKIDSIIADFCIIAVFLKIIDNIVDNEHVLISKTLKLLMRKKYNKAVISYGDAFYKDCCLYIDFINKNPMSTLEQNEIAFASLLGSMIDVVKEKVEIAEADVVQIKKIFNRIGKIILLSDSLIDLEKDIFKNKSNMICVQEGSFDIPIIRNKYYTIYLDYEKSLITECKKSCENNVTSKYFTSAILINLKSLRAKVINTI